MITYTIGSNENIGYGVVGLLYVGLDIGTPIQIATRAGQVYDCNTASAAGILGVTLGYERIPDEWKSAIPALADTKFNYTDYSFHTIIESTEKRAIQLVKRNGGRIEHDSIVVKTQAPKAPKLEIWDDYGSPVERI